MKLLLGILACHHRAYAADMMRELWTKDVRGFDYKFFYGAGSHGDVKPDEVILEGDDAYRGLACKVQNSVRWAVEQGYDAFFKIDDDTAFIADRVFNAAKSEWSTHDYVGRVNGYTDKYHECTYARGGTGYYLSRRAMEHLASRPIPNPDLPKDYAEDSWVGRNMEEGGFKAFNDDRLRCADLSGPQRSPRPNGFKGWKKDIPLRHNDFITCCEFLGAEMPPVRFEWDASNDRHSYLMGRVRIK